MYKRREIVHFVNRQACFSCSSPCILVWIQECQQTTAVLQRPVLMLQFYQATAAQGVYVLRDLLLDHGIAW